MAAIFCIESGTGASRICRCCLCRPDFFISQDNQFDSQTDRSSIQVRAPVWTGNRSLLSVRNGVANSFVMQWRQFVQFLSGISAVDPHFSDDSKWVAYVSYADHTLWRSRSDGTERMQLTYPPMEVAYPFISPDGTRVAFRTPGGKMNVVNMHGGLPRKIIDKSAAVSTREFAARGVQYL